ncbi:integrin beta pat-3-like [Aricia agestis]|uniref:integrin beta pat-3-like n=1 Tax=Aricia agestis TaxID=91739 RepID=UPI001C2042AC|nr:integrin beta pat-3-like [Aricia agestis]
MKFYLCIISLNLFLAASFCCNQHKTCRECIRDEKKCVWCADENHKDIIRCMPEVDASDRCLGHIQNPKNPNATIKRADEFSSEKARIVQLKPQEIKLDLRPGQTIDFDFTYKRVKDYPLDFYFLIDGSASMSNFAKKTAEQSKLMYDMLSRMTNDIFIGMGTFVDKNAVPYTDKVVEKRAYSFKNLLKLNKDYEKFRNTIRDMEFGMNVDEPEGTMDALAQAMACKDEIGWRNQSRKVIVLNTDATYHVAGHGMLASIIQPYDGNCYTKNGFYAKELQMDYPSISILKHMALKGGFVIIFVVKFERLDDYKPLENDMGAKVTTYNEKALEINKILGTIYSNITESIQLQHASDSKYQDYFKITYKPDCSKEDCSVKINDELKFVGTFKLLKYLDVESIPIDITIKGLNEKLHLDVNIIKDCECKAENNSTSCSGKGSKTCGICECYNGWQGEKCQCSLDEGLNIHKERCMANGTECNDRGVCKCGKCKCWDNYFKGDFCECNLQTCILGPNNELCSGHGKCGEDVCGECKCDDDWTGKDCSCSKLQTNCKEEGKKICNGFGECECNKCTCRQPSSWDTRKRDELCRPVQSEAATAAAEQQLQCVQLQPCVLDDLKDGCKHVNVTRVDTLPVNAAEENPENLVDNSEETLDIPAESPELHITEKTQRSSVWIECPEFRADVGCYTRFVYKFKVVEYGVDVQVLSKLNCAETYYWAGGGCLIGLILIGLVTLVCWKILTTRRDRAEYDRFFKEVQSENPELVNPIFAPATVSFSNPAFRRSRHD